MRVIVMFLCMASSLLSTSCTTNPSFGSAIIINHDNVEVFSAPGSGYPVISNLSKDSVVTVQEETKTYDFIGKYYGRWVKIAWNDEKTGYVLDVFLDDVAGDSQFHVFFEKFFSAWKERYEKAETDVSSRSGECFFIERISFPVKVLLFQDESGYLLNPKEVIFKNIVEHDAEGWRNRNKFLTKNHEVHFINDDGPRVMIYTQHRMAASLGWRFKLIDDKWKLVQIEY